MNEPTPRPPRPPHKRAADSFVVATGIVLALTGLVVVGFFVLMSVALASLGSNK